MNTIWRRCVVSAIFMPRAKSD